MIFAPDVNTVMERRELKCDKQSVFLNYDKQF